MALSALVDDPTESWLARNWRRLLVPVGALVALVIVGAAMGHNVPTWLDIHLKKWVDARYKWTQVHRGTSWIFADIFTPIANDLKGWSGDILDLLRALRWPGVLTLVGLIGWRTGGVKAAITGTVSLAMCGVLGVWDDTLITLSLMLMASIAALVIGVPLGVWAGLNDKANRVLRVVMDAAQVLPAYVYLLPMVVFFSIGNASAILATMIFAIAPAVRLTSLGIREVPVVSTEVGMSFGATPWQLLRKVRLPMARKTILLGVNQVIMMGFGVIVIAALVGTGGLGNGVLKGLQAVKVGKAFVPGMALVFAAIALDRISTGTRTRPRRESRWPGWLEFLAGVAVVVVVSVVAKLVGVHGFPRAFTTDLGPPVDRFAKWFSNEFRRGVPVVGGTESFNDVLVRDFLIPLRDFLQQRPWWLVTVAFVAIGWASGGRRVATWCAVCFIGIGSLRVWDLAMDTLSEVLVAVILTVIVAVPAGVMAGRSDRFDKLLRPLLDVAQVMPQFVYLVPMIIMFSTGPVPGIVASVVYAAPPCIRITSLGLRDVSPQPREAAISFGATSSQELLKVQLPLATRSIMLGINQAILMVLSMVVVAALVGAGALGLEAVYGLSRGEIGKGAAGGLAIVFLAMALDRITQAWGAPRRPSAIS